MRTSTQTNGSQVVTENKNSATKENIDKAHQVISNFKKLETGTSEEKQKISQILDQEYKLVEEEELDDLINFIEN